MTRPALTSRSTRQRLGSRIVPAAPTFHEGTCLRIALDYATLRAGLVASVLIEGIEPTAKPRIRYAALLRKAASDSRLGEISFEAGFEQYARGAPMLVDRQSLTSSERNDRTGPKP